MDVKPVYSSFCSVQREEGILEAKKPNKNDGRFYRKQINRRLRLFFVFAFIGFFDSV
jgi:hypothetical protein